MQSAEGTQKSQMPAGAGESVAEVGRLNPRSQIVIRRGLAFVVLYNALLAVWLLLKPTDTGHFRAIDNVAQAVGPALAVFWVTVPYLLRARGRGLARTWAAMREVAGWPPFCLLTIGVATFAAGQMIYSYNEQFGTVSSYGWLADLFYLLGHPCFVLGLLLLPTRPLVPAARSRIFVDSLVIMTAMITFSWHFLLGPIVLNGSTSIGTKIVSSIYPISDLIFICCLLAITYRSRGSLLWPGTAILSAALLVMIATNSTYAFRVIHGTYQTGTLLDIGFSLDVMLICIGARALRMGYEQIPRERRSQRPDDSRSQALPLWASLVPYGLVPAVATLLLYTTLTHGDGRLKIGVYIGAGCLICLTMLRQVLAILENTWLFRSLQGAYQELAVRNRQTQEHAANVERLNAELRAMQNELVQSAKLASLGTLAAGVAHELNQPLAIIRGISQQLNYGDGIDEETRSDLTLIEGQTTRMTKIIQHLRTFSRAGTGDFTRVDVNRTIEDSFILVGAQLKAHDIELELELTEDDPAITGDANQLEQVFINLITNARDAMEGRDRKVITIRTRVNDGYCTIEFSDTGCGVPPDMRARIFDPFFTTKDPGKGTGLGLSISHSIIRRHYGTIQVEDRGGAVFAISLPLAGTVCGEQMDAGEAPIALVRAA